jgi:UDP-N-acetylglucosamine acyltransferase
MHIHPTAIVDPAACLDDEVEIQAFSIVENNVIIGAGSVVGPHCVVGAGTTMGRNNRLYSGAQIGIIPQDLKHLRGVSGKTVIGDGNIFREFVTVSSSTVYNEEERSKETRIGDGCLFMTCSHVAHDCQVGSGVIIANGTALAGHVTVQDRAILGGLTGIHQFCVIGQMAFVGGMSRINKDVLPYMITEGTPARCFGPNSVGLERNGLSREAIHCIRSIYKIIYRSNLNTSQAVDRIRTTIEDCDERRVLLDFIAKSGRGISK